MKSKKLKGVKNISGLPSVEFFAPGIAGDSFSSLRLIVVLFAATTAEKRPNPCRVKK